MKGVRPEFDGKVGAMKHSAKSISNGEVCAFNGAILVGRVGTSREDLITKLAKELANLGVSVKFPSLIHINVFVWASRGIVHEEMA